MFKYVPICEVSKLPLKSIKQYNMNLSPISNYFYRIL